MRIYWNFFLTSIAITLFVYGFTYNIARTENIITNVSISICGDGIIMTGEVCDDGVGNNTGAYATSTASRHCSADCFSWGPYCGDDILQARFDEDCDDGNNLSGDFCSAICMAEIIPPPARGGGSDPRGNVPAGGGVSGSIPSATETKVIIRGKAYPNSDVNILLDGEVINTIKANTNADFLFSSTDITAGTATFGLWAEDNKGNRSISFTTTFNVVQSAVTTVAGIFLPPSINLSGNQLSSGELLTIDGQSIPEVEIFTHIDSGDEEVVIPAEADKAGDWAVQLDTSTLEEEAFHTAKSFFKLKKPGEEELRSGFSRAMNFYVGDKTLEDVVSADINGDDEINLVDFSIFLINWGTDDIRSDFNQDGKVNLADFSIMLFYWTG